MSQPIDQILEQLPLKSAITLVSGADVWHTEALPEQGIAAVLLSDGPHGLRKQDVGGDHLGASGSRPATCFPPAVTLASSWDEDLLLTVGEALGREAVAEEIGVLLGPGLNIKRHPYCGRNFEYFSEDPLLTGRLAAAMVRGIQSQGVAACPKHFAVNNQESYRLIVDAIVDERTLREIYLRGFEIVVRESAPQTVMAAYNQVNGSYATEHEWLLTTVLRDEWGFAGLVMSDWGATSDRVAALKAGMDLEMPGNGGLSDSVLAQAIADGDLARAQLDASVSRVLALATKPRPSAVAVDPAEQHALARKAAAQSTVLLTNNGLLPLRDVRQVAVIGAFAEHPRYQGAGSSLVNPTQVDTALAALRGRKDVAVTYAPGYDPVSSADDKELIADAVAIARAADVALVMVGLPSAFESEGFDRTHLQLPAQHNALVAAVCGVQPNTVVALSNGSPVALPWADRPAAIVESYLGGQASGSALVDVLFGAEDPAGRLAESFPFTAADLAADLYFPGTAQQVQYREGLYVGYRYLDTAGVPVAFPFGHGLSYTTFDYRDLRATVEAVTVTVTNTGDRRGAEVVQVYVNPQASAVPRPDQELRGFEKVWLEPGESVEVSIPLGESAFAVWDVAAGSWQVPPGVYQVRVGSSSRDIRGQAEVVWSGAEVAIPEFDGVVARTDSEFAAMLGHPIPAPRPRSPLGRNSPMGDLVQNRIGRVVRAGLLRVVRPRLVEMAGGDEQMLQRLLAAADEMPLRSLAQLSDGRVSWAALDAVLALLNGKPTVAGRQALAAIRKS